MSRFTDAIQLKQILRADGWKTPDTYCNLFAEAGDFPAIYLFLLLDRESYSKGLVAYVGMSTRLKARWDSHNILPDLYTTTHWAQRFFKPMRRDQLRRAEAECITRFDPPWNIAGRPRGVIAA